MTSLEVEQRKLDLLAAAARLAASSPMEWRAFVEALGGYAEIEVRRLLACDNTNIIHHRQGYALALRDLTSDLVNARDNAAEAKRRVDALSQRMKK